MTFTTHTNPTMHIRRAVLPASPEADTTPSSHLTLLPLLSLCIVVIILLFFAVRMFRRTFHLPSLTWLRGKGKGSKGRLGLSGVELLPTSIKAIPTPNPSPYAAAFHFEGNAGKNDELSLLSRSSSLDALPQLVANSPSPILTSRRRSYSRPPFALPAFLRTKHKPLHRRSRSLNAPHRNSPSSMPVSAPTTPSPREILIDFSTSNSSSSTSASSDLGTHKLHRSSTPLIPGIPIPNPSPEKVYSRPTSAHIWTFDVEDEGDIADSHVTDPLLAAFKPPHLQPSSELALLQDPMTLIQYERPSSPQPTTLSLHPKRFGTANPFASLAGSFTSQTSITDRPVSPLTVSPSSPPGIELVPIKATVTHLKTNLVDLDEDEVYTAEASAVPTAPGTDVDIATYAHDTHVVPDGVLVEPSEMVSDPFDDINAIPVSDEAWESHPAPTSPLERICTPSTHSTSPQSPEAMAICVSPPAASPLSGPPRDEEPEVELSPRVESDPLASSWQWDGSWSPPTFSASQSEWPSVPLPLASEFEAEATENDLMSFDNAQAGVSTEAVGLNIDVDKDMDPADTWFIEEPTAVFDASWTGEGVKGGILFQSGEEKGVKEVDQERQIDIIDELLAGPSESINIHIFETNTEPAPEEPFHDGRVNSINATNDTNDTNDMLIPHSNIATPLIISATPLLSTPATPNTPLPELPSQVIVTSPILEECPDPPLPETPVLVVAPSPLSPVPVKSPSPIYKAQTPTPPASPPPLLNVPTRPLWSLRAADAPPLGLPATATPVTVPAVLVPDPEVPVYEELDLVKVLEIPVIDIGHAASRDAVENTVLEDVSIEVTHLVIHSVPQVNESEADDPPTRPATPQPRLSEILPGAFPSSPSPAPVTLPMDVAAPSSINSDDTIRTDVAHSQTHVAVRHRNPNRLRTPRSVIDIALAMQLRPGLGAGADPAWMVRFLMAMFGWFAILVSGDL